MVCRVLGINRSNIYYRKKNKFDELEKEVVCVFKEHNANYGCPRIKLVLASKNIVISKRRIGNILKKNGLESKHGRRKLAKNIYTKPKERYIAENLIKNRKAFGSNEIWQMDYTEFRCKDGNLYANGLIDISDKVVCMTYSTKADSVMSETTMRKAIELYGVPKIAHTDRGSIYVSKHMLEIFSEFEITRSMSAPHSPNENQYIETFWKTLKIEVGRTKNFTKAKLVMILDYYLDYYNNFRIHSSIQYLTPIQKRRLFELAQTNSNKAIA